MSTPKISLHIGLKRFTNRDGINRFFKDCASRFKLQGWSIDLSPDSRTVGVCNYDRKVIVLSDIYCYRLPRKEIEDTILHEIAHALTPGHEHDLVWKNKALEIGCSGNVECDVEHYQRYRFCCDSCKWSVARSTYDKPYWDNVRCQYCSSRISVIDRD